MPLFALAPTSLQAFRSAVFDAHGADGITLLQQAGYATGEAMFDALSEELLNEGSPPAGQLPSDAFNSRVGAFLQARGWGRVTLSPDEEDSGARAILISVDDGPEARGAGNSDDGCPLTTGVLSGLLSRVVEAPVAVMAVEAGSADAPLRCRFLAASPATVQLAWQAVSEGRDWREALGG